MKFKLSEGDRSVMYSPQSGTRIEFRDGEYETTDKGEQEFLKNQAGVEQVKRQSSSSESNDA
jgi:hypothetical protein